MEQFVCGCFLEFVAEEKISNSISGPEVADRLLYFSDLQNDMAWAIGHAIGVIMHHTVSSIPYLSALCSNLPRPHFASDFVMHVRMKMLNRSEISTSSQTKVCIC